jgi:predicted O-methyltransferase YrrM
MKTHINSTDIVSKETSKRERSGLLHKFLYRFSDLIAVRTTQQIWRSGPYGRQGDTYNIMEMARLAAAIDTGHYYLQNLSAKTSFKSDLDLLSHALSLAPTDGLFLEFGVATGRTINHMARVHRGRIHGFDSFQGLPEVWRPSFAAGAFAQSSLPTVEQNVTLHVGSFGETLPEFLKQESAPISFAHIDCDLYSSTVTIFDNVKSRLQKGTILVFDEYWNYPGWRAHEWKAFQ